MQFKRQAGLSVLPGNHLRQSSCEQHGPHHSQRGKTAIISQQPLLQTTETTSKLWTFFRFVAESTNNAGKLGMAYQLLAPQRESEGPSGTENKEAELSPSKKSTPPRES
jgi:hypothetical protein